MGFFEDLDGIVADSKNAESQDTNTASTPTTQQPPTFFDDLDSIVKSSKDTETQQYLNNRGWLGNLGSAAARGVVGAGETMLRAARALDPEGGTDIVNDLTTRGIEGINKFKEETPFLQQSPNEQSGFLPKAVSGGVESAAQSIVSGLPGMAAGAAIGSAVPVVGTALGALAGYALSGGTTFGLSQFDQTLEEAKKAGVPHDKAVKEAVIQGLAEGGFEFASDLIGGHILGLDNPVTKPAKEALKQGIKSMLSQTIGQFAKKAAMTTAVETGSEMLTGGVQAESQKRLGLGDQSFWDGAKEAFGPSVVASLIFASLGGAGAHFERQHIKTSLENPNVDAKSRAGAVEQVYGTLKQVDPTVAEAWKTNAMDSISNNRSIATDEDLYAKIQNLSSIPEKSRTEQQQANLSAYQKEYEDRLNEVGIKNQYGVPTRASDLESEKQFLEQQLRSAGENAPQIQQRLDQVNSALETEDLYQQQRQNVGMPPSQESTIPDEELIKKTQNLASNPKRNEVQERNYEVYQKELERRLAERQKKEEKLRKEFENEPDIRSEMLMQNPLTPTGYRAPSLDTLTRKPFPMPEVEQKISNLESVPEKARTEQQRTSENLKAYRTGITPGIANITPLRTQEATSAEDRREQIRSVISSEIDTGNQVVDAIKNYMKANGISYLTPSEMADIAKPIVDKQPRLPLSEHIAYSREELPYNPYPDYMFRVAPVDEWNKIQGGEKSGTYWHPSPLRYTKDSVIRRDDSVLLVADNNQRKGNLIATDKWEGNREYRTTRNNADIAAAYKWNNESRMWEPIYFRDDNVKTALEGGTGAEEIRGNQKQSPEAGQVSGEVERGSIENFRSLSGTEGEQGTVTGSEAVGEGQEEVAKTNAIPEQKPGTVRLYHYTKSPENVDAIMKEGLRPAQDLGKGHGESEVFFYNTPPDKGAAADFVVDVPVNDPKLNAVNDRLYTYTGSVPKEHITAYRTGEDFGGQWIPGEWKSVQQQSPSPPLSPEAPAGKVAKEPWEMSRSEYLQTPEGMRPSKRGSYHFKSVVQAIEEGKPIDYETVLKDYPQVWTKIKEAWEIPSSVFKANPNFSRSILNVGNSFRDSAGRIIGRLVDDAKQGRQFSRQDALDLAKALGQTVEKGLGGERGANGLASGNTININRNIWTDKNWKPSTFFHELTHNLLKSKGSQDKVWELKKGEPLVKGEWLEVQDMLQQFWKKNRQYFTQQTERYARLGELFFTRNQELKEKAPTLYNKFEKLLYENLNIPAGRLAQLEFDKDSQSAHKFFVKQALSEGKPVPANVLAEYPDLAKQASNTEQPTAKTEQVPGTKEGEKPQYSLRTLRDKTRYVEPWSTPQQEIDSAATSINEDMLPKTFTTKAFLDTVASELKTNGKVKILSIGDGKFDNVKNLFNKAQIPSKANAKAKETYSEKIIPIVKNGGVTYLSQDPFNRTKEENEATRKAAQNGQSDVVVNNNVLNVIREYPARQVVYSTAANALKAEGKAFFLVYPSFGDNVGAETKTTDKQTRQKTVSWQNRAPSHAYVGEVGRYFRNVRMTDGIIEASDPIKNRQEVERRDVEEYSGWKTENGKWQNGRPILLNYSGSKIARGGSLGGQQYPVGKIVGSQVYFHKDYLKNMPARVQELARIGLSKLPDDFKYETMMYDMGSKKSEERIRFDEAKNFNTSREPIPGKMFVVFPDGRTRTDYNDQIWHHKWQWVGDDYKGFNVNSAFDWSKEYLGKILGMPNGRLEVWNQQLEDHGLGDRVEEGGFKKSVNFMLRTPEAQKTISTISDNLKSSVKGGIHVVEKFTDLPYHLQSDAVQMAKGDVDGIQGQVRGILDQKSDAVYLVASNLKDANEAQFVLLHEVLGHRAINSVLGEKATSFFNDLFAVKQSQMADHIRTYEADVKTREGRSLAASEWFADEVAAGRYNSPGLKGWWNRFVTMFREGMRKLGFTLKLSDAEIADVVRRARKSVEQGAAPILGNTQFLLRRQQQPTEQTVSGVEQSEYQKRWLAHKDSLDFLKDSVKAAVSKEAVSNFLTKAYTKLIMGEYPVVNTARKIGGEDFAKAIENQIRRIRSRTSVAESTLKHGIVDDSFNKVSESLHEILKPLGTKQRMVDYETMRISERSIALHEYSTEQLVNLRAQEARMRSELPQMKKEPGWNDRKAKKYVEAYKATKQEIARLEKLIEGIPPLADSRAELARIESKYTPQEMQEFRSISDKHRKFEDEAILKPLVKIGKISQERYDQIKNSPTSKYYASFMREMDDVENTVVSGGKTPSAIKQLKGSQRRILPPIEGTIANLANVTKLVETQKLNQEFVKIADMPGGEDVVQKITASPDRIPKDAITVYKDGKTYYYKVPSDVAKAMDYYSPNETNFMVKFLSFPATTLRMGATLAMDFVVRNPVRDQFTAMVYSKYGYVPFKDLVKGMFHFYRDDALYKEFKAAGGEQNYFSMMDREATILKAADLVGYKKTGIERYVQLVKSPYEFYTKLSQALETGTRLGEYEKARKTGLSPSEAMGAAKDLTLDFQRKGGDQVIRAMNQITAFWNANVQGTDKMVREFKNPHTRMRTLMRATLGITMPSLILWALFHDDDRWKELPDWRKNFFWNIPIGKDGPILSMPKPFELGLIFGSLFERILDWQYGKDPKAMKSIAGAIKDGLFPGMIPTSVLPIIESYTNYNFFMGTPIESESDKNLPPEMRANQYTSESLKRLGAATGISPKMLENWARAWTGNLGKMGLDVIDSPLREGIEPVEKKWYERAGIRAFFAKEPVGSAGKALDRFYDAYEESTQADAGLKVLRKSGNIQDAQKYQVENAPKIRMAHDARLVSDKLSQLRKQKASVMQSKGMYSEMKRQQVDRIDTRMSDLAKSFNERYARALKAMQ